MKYLYHVHVRAENVTFGRAVQSSQTYHVARDHALARYRAADLGTLVEITHAGSIVWGPFVVGGKYLPTDPSK